MLIAPCTCPKLPAPYTPLLKLKKQSNMAASSSSSELLQAHAELWNLTFGYLRSMAVQCAVSLGIPNAIHRRGGAASLSDLVASVAVPERRKPYLPRLMRFLAATGIVAALDDAAASAGGEAAAGGDDGGAVVYRLTPMSRLLVDDDGCGGLSPWVLSQTTRQLVAAAQCLSGWFMGDDAAAAATAMPFEMAHGGVGPWDAARGDPEFSRVFNAGMAADSRLALEFVVARCGDVFDGVSSLVDVGGGTGGAARVIGRAFPRVKCSVLDLPHVVASVEQPAGDGLVEYIAGDMMEFIPPADAVLLKYVLHDWNDEVCMKILTQCKKAVCSGEPEVWGKVIIIDTILGSSSNKTMFEAQVTLDLLMMVATSGKERQEHEWRKMFMDAGFRHYKARPIMGCMSIIELYP
ncbi:hypothetical protein ACP4OV_014479 [Aristida adscensionis]